MKKLLDVTKACVCANLYGNDVPLQLRYIGELHSNPKRYLFGLYDDEVLIICDEFGKYSYIDNDEYQYHNVENLPETFTSWHIYTKVLDEWQLHTIHYDEEVAKQEYKLCVGENEANKYKFILKKIEIDMEENDYEDL